METSERKCIECGGAMRAIEVYHRLSYAETDGEKSWFAGTYPTSGILDAEACKECGRVVFRTLKYKSE